MDQDGCAQQAQKALAPALGCGFRRDVLDSHPLPPRILRSGAIDAVELGAAFKLLGINMKRAELEAMLAEVDHDGSGEVEYTEFLEIMTVTLQRLADEAEDNASNEGQVGLERYRYAVLMSFVDSSQVCSSRRALRPASEGQVDTPLLRKWDLNPPYLRNRSPLPSWQRRIGASG
jgi:hypothetical protein